MANRSLLLCQMWLFPLPPLSVCYQDTPQTVAFAQWFYRFFNRPNITTALHVTHASIGVLDIGVYYSLDHISSLQIGGGPQRSLHAFRRREGRWGGGSLVYFDAALGTKCRLLKQCFSFVRVGGCVSLSAASRCAVRLRASLPAFVFGSRSSCEGGGGGGRGRVDTK